MLTASTLNVKCAFGSGRVRPCAVGGPGAGRGTADRGRPAPVAEVGSSDRPSREQQSFCAECRPVSRVHVSMRVAGPRTTGRRLATEFLQRSRRWPCRPHVTAVEHAEWRRGETGVSPGTEEKPRCRILRRRYSSTRPATRGSTLRWRAAATVCWWERQHVPLGELEHEALCGDDEAHDLVQDRLVRRSPC